MGAALSWLARCGDVARCNAVLAPLAAAVSAGGDAAAAQEVALAVLQPVLAGLPPGSANAALLDVHRLLRHGADGGDDAAAASGSGMHAAVAALSQLPERLRDSCLQLVCGALPALPPGALSEADVHYLLQWLLVREGGRCRVVTSGMLLARRPCCRFMRARAPPPSARVPPTIQPFFLFQGAEARLPVGKGTSAASIQVARLALVRGLAASHMLATAPTAQQAGAA